MDPQVHATCCFMATLGSHSEHQRPTMDREQQEPEQQEAQRPRPWEILVALLGIAATWIPSEDSLKGWNSFWGPIRPAIHNGLGDLNN